MIVITAPTSQIGRQVVHRLLAAEKAVRVIAREPRYLPPQVHERGIFFSAVDPARKLPACATRDIAETATRLLSDASWSGVGEVALLGPEDLSFDDMAGIMSEVLGKPIRCQRIDYAAYKAQFLRGGMSDAMAQGMADMARAKSEGLDNGRGRTPENTTPTRFRQWCEDALRPAPALPEQV